MALVRHEGRRELGSLRRDLFDRFFDDFPDVFRRPLLVWPDRGAETFGVEEFTEDHTLVIRIELAGIDPDKDVDISVDDDVLHIAAERREEEKDEGRDYVRREFRYGSFHRDLPLPRGTSGDDVAAAYKDGILEVRVPLPEREGTATKKVPVAKS